MPMTVGEVIALPAVQRGAPEVLSAQRWDEPIRWVHSSDLADLSSLLQGGELVLTTGAALARAPRTYLRGLADAGALGVVVEVGTQVVELPPGAGGIADELGLALVVLHRAVRFVDITEAVHRRIVAEQYEEVAFDRRVHETFTDLSMKRASLTGIVDAAARMLDEPVVLEDLSHQAVAVSTGIAADLLEDWERRSRRSPGRGGNAEPWTVTGVGPRSQQWGRLVVPRAPADVQRTTMVLERAAAALAMHRMIEQDRTGLQQQAQSGLIDDVLRGRITEERDVAARAQALGLRRCAQYFPAVVRATRPPLSADPVADHRRNVAFLDAVAHTVTAAGHSGLFSRRADAEVGMILALKDSRSVERALAALGDRLRDEVCRVDGVTTSVLALGPPAEQITDAVAGLSEAAHIAEVASALRPGERSFFRASDVRLRGLLSLLRDDERVQRFAETELRAVLFDESTAVPSNLAVLREYLRLAGNKAALAQRLHMSRPALYKRLAAIRDALGVDLDDGESMTSLHVALMIVDAAAGERSR
ncbi:PucR family transcriptional regulator ligand-binding domain-containing protein [Mycolicibacterium rufum]|uniref:PucR family transcriptional regulator ligand-binding domain-containing protein n=1 Tax=Mycolicibacterium rufum TaxID=318424 RepID=A0ABY3UN84_9MYCO|nr:PucR family transcriptional regulator ligand-binding domain-containing protein [Mycolicibacterium rufum]KGI67558.1 PucR family transcriptional regulator [Mycolicibacterium rufum]ULP38523.1 PucR family transcriptional regulator ligand-binding domain-containing protein [Mycolicibacterium rufum]